MPISEICNHQVISAPRDTTVRDAAKLMKQHNIGDVVITDDDSIHAPVGMLTDRDITIKIIADELDINAAKVDDLMSKNLLILNANQGIQEAIDMMCNKSVRRAPVVDSSNKIIGIVTVDDLVCLLANELNCLSKLINNQITQ